MKRLFFLAVLLGTFILSGIFAFSYWQLQARTPQSYFELGKQYYEQGRFDEALLEFHNALKRDESHRDSHYYLALTYLAKQDIALGSQQLKLLLDAHPEDVQANLKLGKLYLAGGPASRDFYQRARELAEQILKKNPENLSALILAGNAAAGLQDYEASRAFLDKAVSAAPDDVTPWISIGSAFARQKKFAEAEKAFLKAHEIDPKDKNAFISLANLYRLTGAPEKAENVFNQALAQYPADREVYSQVVEFYASNRRLGDVERLLKAAQAATQDDPSPSIDLADFYLAQNRKADSLGVLLEAKSKFPGSTALGIKLATNLMRDKSDLARAEIDQILKREPNNTTAIALLAEYQYLSGQFDAAERTLAKLAGSFNPAVHYLLGNLELRKGRTVEAEQYFKRSIEIDGRYVPGRIAILNGLVSQNRLVEARDLVKEILKLDPRNMPARMIKASLDLADKDYTVAESGLNELVREFPDNFAIHRQLGLYYASRSRTGEAEQSFLRAIELAPNSEQLFRDLTGFYLKTGQPERAQQKLKSIPDREKQAYHYQLLGIISEQAGKFQESESAYKNAIDKDPKALAAELNLFKLYLRIGRKDDAVKTLDSLAQKSPSSSAVFAMKGTIQQGQGDLQGAEANFRKALEIDPASDLAANNLAYLLSHEGRDLAHALQMAEGAKRRQPESPEIADTLAWVYYKLDRLHQARNQAQFAVSKKPGNGEFQYHLGEIYLKNSEKSKAAAALKKAANSSNDFPERSLAVDSLKEIRE